MAQVKHWFFDKIYEDNIITGSVLNTNSSSALCKWLMNDDASGQQSMWPIAKTDPRSVGS